jgi:hypothetical protein
MANTERQFVRSKQQGRTEHGQVNSWSRSQDGNTICRDRVCRQGMGIVCNAGSRMVREVGVEVETGNGPGANQRL